MESAFMRPYHARGVPHLRQGTVRVRASREDGGTGLGGVDIEPSRRRQMFLVLGPAGAGPPVGHVIPCHIHRRRHARIEWASKRHRPIQLHLSLFVSRGHHSVLQPADSIRLTVFLVCLVRQPVLASEPYASPCASMIRRKSHSATCGTMLLPRLLSRSIRWEIPSTPRQTRGVALHRSGPAASV
jgi:hypothetical protein